MKKLFTSVFLMLTGVFGGLNAFAADEVKDLTADMFYTWDGYGADAAKLNPATVDFNVGNGTELGGGSMVCGTSSVDYLIYADLTGSTKLIFEGTAGVQMRVLMNRQESNNGPLVEKNPVIGADGTAELDLTDLDYVHINAIKTGWGSAAGQINSIKFVKPGDPLELPKEQLKNDLNTAKMYNSIAMTEASFSALQDAIAEGEAALAAEDATVESLDAARKAVNEAVEGLELAEGYSELTKEMFKEYESVEEPGEGKEVPNCGYQLFESSGLPYGDGNVYYLLWADLSDYDNLIVTVKQGTPRFCMNRLTAGGQQAPTQADSEMLDINPNNGLMWSTEAYQTVNEDNTIFTIDLKKIVEGEGDIKGYGYAHLNCIKGAHYGNVFVTGMYLYKGTATAVNGVSVNEGSADVYTTSGVKVMKAADKSDLKNLPKGIYIHNGKKIVVK